MTERMIEDDLTPEEVAAYRWIQWTHRVPARSECGEYIAFQINLWFGFFAWQFISKRHRFGLIVQTRAAYTARLLALGPYRNA